MSRACENVFVVVPVRIAPVPVLSFAEGAPLKEIAQAAASNNMNSAVHVQAKFHPRSSTKSFSLL